MIFWAEVVTLAILMIRSLVRQSRHGGKGDPAMQILRTRYAKGEIPGEELEERKRLLES